MNTAVSEANHIGVWILLFVGGVLASLIHLSSSETATASIAWGTALLIGGISVAFFGGQRFDMFSPIFFIGMSFCIHYGLSAMVPFLIEGDGLHSRRIIDRVIPFYPQAGMVSFLCLLGLFCGYNNRWVIIKGRGSSLLCWRPSRVGLKALWCLLAACGVGAFILLIKNNAYLQTTTDLQSPLFYSTVWFLQNGLLVATGMAVIMALNSRRWFWIYAAWVSVFVTLLFGIPSGSKTLALLGLMILGLAWNYRGRPFSRKQAGMAITGVFVVLFIITPFNAVYRSGLLATGSKQQSLTLAFEGMQSALEQVSYQGREETLGLAIDLTSRLSNISVVANVLLYQAEGGDPHFGGSYARILYSLIPRFLWESKPPLTIGQLVAVELGYSRGEIERLGEHVSVTSVGITTVGEQVYNFSWVFAPFGMIVLGMFYRWLYEVFRNGLSISPEIAVGVYAFWWYALVFTGAGTNFAAVLAGGVKYTLFIFLLLLLLRFKKLSFRPVALA